MKPGNGKRVALASVAVGLAVMAVAAVASWDLVAETWWIYKLGSPEPEQRRQAAKKLGELRSRRAIPGLVKLYSKKSEHSEVLLSILVRIGPPAVAALLKSDPDISFDGESDSTTTTILLDCLDDPDPGVRCSALRNLRRRVGWEWEHNQAVLEKVAACLNRETYLPARLRAAELFVRIHPPWSLRPAEKSIRSAIVDAMQVEDEASRREAIALLHKIGAEAAFVVPALARALADPEVELRKMAVEGIGDLGLRAESAIPALMRVAILDPDPGAREAAQLALLQIIPDREGSQFDGLDPQAVIPGMIRDLAAPDRRLRMRAINFLAWIGIEARAAVPSLLAILENKIGNENDRIVSARALARIGRGDEKVARALLDVLDGGLNSNVRGSAARALGELSIESSIPALRKLLREGDDSLQADAVRALGELGPAAGEAAPEIARLLASQNETSRTQAAWALWKITREIKQTLPIIMKSIAGWDNEAIQAVAEMGPAARDAVPVICEMLGESVCVQAATKALGKFGKLAVPHLINALQGNDWFVRTRAAQVLGQIGPEARDAVPALEALAGEQDQDEEVVQAAADALAKIRGGTR